MERIILSTVHLERFRVFLEEEEKSSSTVEKYLRDSRKFWEFAAGQGITKELVVAYKQHLMEAHYALRSINSMLAAVNCLLQFLGLYECRVKQLRVQREIFRPEEKELTHDEYLRILTAAKGKPKIQLVLQSICSTGIRVSELRFFTVDSVRSGTVTVSCKNKHRTVLLPEKLRNQLLKYAEKHKITQGCIFITRNGKPLNRSYIWAQMKRLCKAAGVNPSKVFPHNLRKLFSRSFYALDRDIVKLADVLGHSNIETTRIYIVSTGVEHRKIIEQLKLVL